MLYAQVKEWTRRKKATVFGMFLKSTAWHWYTELPPRTRKDWNALAQEFLAYYDHEKFRIIKLNELMARKNETI